MTITEDYDIGGEITTPISHAKVPCDYNVTHLTFTEELD